MPDISIIIPVYNTAPYLPATIDSMKALDTSLSYQFICVNDGSTDDSPAMLQAWADQDPRVEIITQSNQGLSAARNVALPHVRAPWIYFLDSDDLLLPNALTSAHAESTRLQADVLLFSGTIIDEAGNLIDEQTGTVFTHQRYQRPEALPAGRLLDGGEVMGILMRNVIFRAVTWLYILRTDFLRQTGLSFLPGIIHEDELFTTTLLLSCRRVATMHQTCVLHRIRQSSIMGARFSRRNMDCYLTVFDGVGEWLASHPERRSIGWKYVAYTMNHVLRTARCLPLRDRLATLRRIVASGYLPYVEPKRLLAFAYGK